MQPLIECKNIGFSVSPDKFIFVNTNLLINAGDFVVVLGGNGSGKSTLIKLINQTYQATTGDILLKQKSIRDYSAVQMRQEIVTLTQSINDSLFLDLTVEENALLIETMNATPTRQSLPEYLATFHQKLATHLKTRVKQLSGGEQQILAFALYLRHKPDLLLLDEHTSALDPKKSDAVMQFTDEFIRKEKLTCLMTTHELKYALQYGNRLIALRDGQIVFDVRDEEKKSLTMMDLLEHCY